MRKTRTFLATAVASVMMLCSLTACGDDAANGAGAQFTITLYPDCAPITCENFEKLVSEGFYDGLTFHRVVDDFMAQGGDPMGNGSGGSKDTIKGEFSKNGVDNPLSHTRGIVSMARSSAMDSASSQFFICYTDDCTFLDGSYAAFGEVTEGMEVVDSFLQVERTLGGDRAISAPVEPIIIDTAVMIEDDADGNPRVLFTMKQIPVAD
ncbi:MAG: peptidylprolyl isomerase [Oscillospiraceae bacterium]